MDPRQVLPAARHRPADAELEERQHLLQRAAALVEHDAGADPHDAHAERLGGGRLALPRDADAGEEVVAGRRLLGHRLVAVRAVVADRGGGDEHARARVGGARARRRGCASPARASAAGAASRRPSSAG